jgi:hypothetical protein
MLATLSAVAVTAAAVVPIEDGDEDDEDIEEFAEVMAELVSHIHSIFGNNVTFTLSLTDLRLPQRREVMLYE